MTVNISGLDHIALRVTNIARSKAFYTETLGFQVAVEIPTLLLVTGYGIQLGMRGDEAQTPTRIKLILPRRAQGGVDRC